MFDADSNTEMPVEHSLIGRSILFRALGLDQSDVPTQNHYLASWAGEELRVCHDLADAGLLHFSPSKKSPTLFLVTESGAAIFGHELKADDALWLRITTTWRPAPDSEEEIYRQALRLQQRGRGAEGRPNFRSENVVA